MVKLTFDPIDPATVLQSVFRRDCGGNVLFVGTVRELTGDQNTIALEYEAHASMAEKVLNQIAEETRSKWSVGGLAAVHRLGNLDVNEVAVAVAVSCPHRAE